MAALRDFIKVVYLIRLVPGFGMEGTSGVRRLKRAEAEVSRLDRRNLKVHPSLMKARVVAIEQLKSTASTSGSEYPCNGRI